MATSRTGADAVYSTMIVQLGVDTQTCRRRDNIQQQAAQSLDDARNAQAGVSTDEEMTNIVEFQKATRPSAKFVTTIDSMLDTLINMVGP